MLEDFKNCLPEVVSVYLNEQKSVTLEQAAILADEFALTHKVNFGDKQVESLSKGQNNRFQLSFLFPLLLRSWLVIVQLQKGSVFIVKKQIILFETVLF